MRLFGDTVSAFFLQLLEVDGFLHQEIDENLTFFDDGWVDSALVKLFVHLDELLDRVLQGLL